MRWGDEPEKEGRERRETKDLLYVRLIEVYSGTSKLQGTLSETRAGRLRNPVPGVNRFDLIMYVRSSSPLPRAICQKSSCSRQN